MRKNAHNAVEYLEKLVAFDTVSRNSNLQLIGFVAEELGQLGIECDIIEDPTGTKANLFATLGGPADVPGIVLSGHTDVVPVEGQDWITDPFQMVERDGKLFGRGTCDMKGFLAICLALAPEIKAANLREPLHIAFSYDEEVGCRGVRSMIDKVKDRSPKPRACIIGEPTSMKVVNAHKGIRAYSTEINGREAHSSNTEFGESAVFAAARLIEFFRQLLEEHRANADPASRFDPPYTSINVGRLRGGTALNIIPNHCQFEWEYRSLPDADDDDVFNRLTRFANEIVLPEMLANFPEAKITTTELARAPALMPLEGSPAEALVLALIGQNEPVTAAYATEAGLFQEADIPSVVCGPGSIDQAHRPNEFIKISEMEAGTDFVEKLVAALTV
ncbi:MAG: acetylornithine deacetylase [Proteobacteria bacterium]|nr:acetylornithine deacetylase [Pseudomonadota bacterium]